MAAHSTRPATFEDILRRGDLDRLEIIDGEILEKAVPSMDHADAENSVSGVIFPFKGKPGKRGPGGWWLATEIHVLYSQHNVFCHDVAGWRRDRTDRPTGFPVRIRPDWVCEILSPGHEKRDLVDKARVLHGAEVPHYWIVSHEERLLLVHRWAPGGYDVVLRAAAGETVRAEPFDAIEIAVSDLFGDDD